MEVPMIDVQTKGGVATLTMDRPPVNAFDLDQVARLETALDEAASDSVQTILIRSSGRIFSAGADIKMMAGFLASDDGPQQLAAFASRFQTVLNRLADQEAVTIAAVNGAALGGGLEVAMACDLRIAAEGAVLGLPEANIGLLPGGGGTQRLSQLAGRSFALSTMLLSRTFTAEQGMARGVITEVVPAVSLDARIEDVVSVLSARPRETLVQIKRCVAASGSPAGFYTEVDATRVLASMPSTLELMQSFLRRRSGSQ